MMLYAVLLLTVACSAVCGTAQDEKKYRHNGRSVLEMCLIREGCKEIALTHPSPDDPSPLKDLCTAVGEKLGALDNRVCDSLLSPDNANDDPPETDGAQLPPRSDPAALALSGRTNYFEDCSDIHTALAMFNAVSSGIHDIKPAGLESPISVNCDQLTDGGGWTVIQRRFDGSIDFNRPYGAFQYGFGSVFGEQWLGLENIYRLTNQNAYELYIELEDWGGVVKYAKYASFSVGGSSTYYRLNVGGYSGTAGDGFSLSYSTTYGHYQNGQGFSARDVDNDTKSGSCAASLSSVTGGWWYKSCGLSALHGPYLRPSDYTTHSGRGIHWAPFGGPYYTYLKKSKMMVRPVDFEP
ncbi:ANGPTL2 [Branchiostoma lanceolatum]|uniref:ANGPTL2 protein n=1 Tax=Branchiostoma lanceolatum TaxID=7740 RepID=A0A8K0A3X2_BRALA|nr:ANGPTL2 [Branchiostoma lanceolatum]